MFFLFYNTYYANPREFLADVILKLSPMAMDPGNMNSRLGSRKSKSFRGPSRATSSAKFKFLRPIRSAASGRTDFTMKRVDEAVF